MSHEPIFFDIETTGFDPMPQAGWDDSSYDPRVTAIGLATADNWRSAEGPEDVETDTKVLYDSSEYRLLEVAAERLDEIGSEVMADGDAPFLVGYNSRKFDHPYLGARYARLRIDGSRFNRLAQRLDMMRAVKKHPHLVDKLTEEVIDRSEV